MLDKYNRNITYLRVSIIDRCNLRCTYCMPEDGIIKKKKSEIISFEDIIKIIEAGTELGIKKMRITGGEPLIRNGIVEFIKKCKSIEGLEEVTLTTNGILLDKMAENLYNAGLDRLNISIDTLNSEKYKKITRGGNILRVFAGLEKIIDVGFKKTKINTVVMPDFNGDEIEKINEFCISKGFTLQRINHYSLSDINSINKKYNAERPLSCLECNRIRLTADGKLKPCLFSDIEIPVDFNNIKESLISAINYKPKSGTQNITRPNWQIGG